MTLNLDLRQRAILQELGVRLWLPQSAVSTPVAVATGDRSALVHPEPTPNTLLRPLAQVAGDNLRANDIDRMTWLELHSAVTSCQACGLCQGRSKTVFGVGGLAPLSADLAPRASWLVVGEAPGEQEDRRGEPFVGPAGQLLDNMLAAIDLDRRRRAPAGTGQAAQGVFIANVLKCRPPGNRNPEPAEVASCAPYLKRQIELLQPKLILATGRFAAQVLLQDSVADVQSIPLGKLRSHVHTYRDIPVVVTYHPAYLLRALGDKAKAWADLCLAMETLTQARKMVG